MSLSKVENEVKFSVQMQVMDMYRFLMYHAYHGFGGIANIILSGGALILFLAGVGKGDTFARVMLILIALLFTVINPIFLLYKAAKQVKLTPMFSKPLDYLVNEQGIKVSQGEEELQTSWEEVTKVVETTKAFYIYLSLTRSYLFSKENLKGQEAEFKKLLMVHVEKRKCKLK